MNETSKTLGSWVTFAGCVLVVAVLFWAQAVIMPVALACVITFVLARPVGWLQRWIGRVAAVLVTVALLSIVMGLASWGIARQVSGLATDLPGYRANIRQKIRDVRGMGENGSVARIQQTLEDIKTDLATGEKAARGTPARSVVVEPQHITGIWTLSNWLGPLVGPLSTAGLVVVLVIFMLLERQDLRSRLIGLVGHGHLAVTTKALDETAERVSRQLLMQTIVNLIYGAGVLVGLTLIGVPYALLWAALGAALRFIPYLGPLLAAAAPIAIALAALPGWTKPLYVVGLFTGLELFTNLVLETVLYAGAVGVSQVALLVAVAFWTWLWGSMGLLLATPLTVCLVVVGKHVRGLGFLTTLMADQPALASDKAYYQRLLARDQDEAAEMLERHIKAEAPETVYDGLLLPALNYAERDVAESRLEPEEEQDVIDATRELVRDAGALIPTVIEESAPVPSEMPDASLRVPVETPPLVVLGVPANGTADETALQMLEQLMAPGRITLEVTSPRLLTAEILARLEEQGMSVICIADLPPSPPSRTRYLVKKLRAMRPGLHIVVGRWAPPELADVGSSRVDLQACKLEYSIVSPK